MWKTVGKKLGKGIARVNSRSLVLTFQRQTANARVQEAAEQAAAAVAVKDLRQNLKDRFPVHDTTVLLALDILDVSRMPPDAIHSSYGEAQIDQLLVHYGQEIIVSVDNGDRMSHGPIIDDDLRSEFKFFKEHLLFKGVCSGKVGGDGQSINNDSCGSVFHYILTDTQCKKWFQCMYRSVDLFDYQIDVTYM